MTYGPSESYGPPGGAAPQQTANEDVHREAFERERRKPEVAQDRHLEDLDVAEDRHRINPLRARPEIPEFPEPATDETSDKQVDEPIVAACAPIAKQRFVSGASVDRIEQKDEPEK